MPPTEIDLEAIDNQIELIDETLSKLPGANNEEPPAPDTTPVTRQEAIDSFNLPSPPSSASSVREGIPMYEQEVNQLEMDPKDFGLGENIIEARNAIAKGGAEAVGNALTAPERLLDAASGKEIGDPDYRPEWDPVGDNLPTPMVRTFWGSLLEDVTHYGTYGAGLILATKGAAAAMGSVGVGMTSAGIAALLSSKHDGDNLTGKLIKKVPALEPVVGPIATKDSDHPVLKKFKNVMEEMSMAGIFDKLLGHVFGSDGLEKALVRAKNVNDQIVEKGRIELDDAVRQLEAEIIPVEVKDITGQPKLSGTPERGGATVRFRGHMNKPIADPWQGSPNSTNTPFDIHTQLNKIDNDHFAKGGSTDSPLTPAQAERMATESGLTEEYLQNTAKELLGDARYQRMVGDLKKERKSFREYFEPAYRRYQEMMGRDLAGMDPDEFWRPFFKNEGGLDRILGIDTWTNEDVLAADLINSALFKQLRDLSIGAKEIFNIADVMATDGPMKTISDRLIIGLSEVKKNRYLWSTKGVALQGPKGAKRRAEITANLAKIHEGTRNQVEMAIQLIGKDDNQRLLEGFIEAMSMSDKIHNWLDLDAFMKHQLRSFGNENVALRELSGVMINSILSGVKTPIRALVGTGNVGVMQPMARALGAVSRGDIQTARANLAGLKAFGESIPESFKIFRTRMDGYFTGDLSNMRTRFTDTNKLDTQWEALGRWSEMRGTKGDKAAYRLANIARGLNDSRLLSWSPRVMASMDDTYKVLMARMRARERAVNQALSMKKRGDIYDIQPGDIASIEDGFLRQLLDRDGNVDLAADGFLDKAFKEASLTEDLSGIAAKLDAVFEQFPLLKPFYLFARTGVNGLNLTFKNSPGLGLLHKRHIDVLSANPENLESVLKYGINTPEDLANEKALIAGRQLMGSGVVFMGTQKYLAGEMTGNGPQDRSMRQAWIDAGFKPRSIKIGGVWVGYDLAEPYSTILATMCDIGDNMELMGEEWSEDGWLKMALAIGGGATSKSYLAGLNDLVDMFSSEPGALNRPLANILNNTVPLAGVRNDFGRIVTPYMRELSGEIDDSIRNRNLATEQVAGKPLAIKYDILTGKPLRDWNPMQRIVNAVLPINLSLDNMSPGRKLFLESGFDSRLSVMSAPGDYDLSDSPEVRSLFQRAIGQQNLEAKLNKLAARKDVQDSLDDMEEDKRNGNMERDPMRAYRHNDLIGALFRDAKNAAWQKIQNEPAVQELVAEQDKLDKANRDRRSSQNEPLPPILSVY
jgi:hypothetical protein